MTSCTILFASCVETKEKKKKNSENFISLFNYLTRSKFLLARILGFKRILSSSNLIRIVERTCSWFSSFRNIFETTRTIDRRRILLRTSCVKARGENYLIFRFDALWKSTRTKEELSSAKLSSSDQQQRRSQHAAADNLFFTIHFASPGCVSCSFTSRAIGFIADISRARSRSAINHARHCTMTRVAR